MVIWNLGGNSDLDEVSLARDEIGIELDSQMIDVGEIRLHVVFAGPHDGEPVVLIHGFPEHWYMWRYHMVRLADAGYRVAALDMRGYNRSEKPAGRSAYSYTNYSNDIVLLMDTQDWQQANFVGHDIGARIVWKLVFDHSERVKRAAIFSVGHPMAVDQSGRGSAGGFRQFFNLPILPELLSRAGGLELIRRNMRRTSRDGTFPDEELSVYTAAWDHDHAFATMLGAYRNGGEAFANIPDDGRPAMPVAFFYGLEDQFISQKQAALTGSYIGVDNVVAYPGLSHWLLQEEPALTGDALIKFLTSFEK